MTDATATVERKYELPDGHTLESWMTSRLARFEDRKPDWDALKFQADYDPKYKRAQIRYVGTGATGVATDGNTVPAEHFTFSTMVLPAGCEGPLHIHTDAEEIFFIMRGQKVRLFFELNGETFETIAHERDLVSVPKGVYRGLRNEGTEEALMIVAIGSPKPVIPTYPESHPLSKVKRPKL